MERLHEWSFKPKTLEEDFYFDYGAEEITDYQDPSELLAALKQKEEEVILAAQLGNALLLENRQLKEQSDKLHEQFTDKLEELEQGRHELRLKLEGCQSHWESQVGELERDVRELSAQVEQLTQALSEAERDKGRLQLEHGEQTQRLREELRTVSPTQKNKPLWPTDPLFQKLLLLLFVKLREAWQEVEVARDRSQQLQAQVEELQEEVSLQDSRTHLDASLLSELEAADWEAEVVLTRHTPRMFICSYFEKQFCNVKKGMNTLKHFVLSLNRKNLMEAELVRSKNDMMCLNNQLLDAIQRKLELSQELEAWQDDIQIVINQQLKSQQQTEQPQKKPTSNGLAFFRRPSRTASTWTLFKNVHTKCNMHL
uniref:Si:ch211-235m3.5 n=1 Tax=Poecilia reticulata TaxID=8081 RepID=A0A3P9QG77_POERE